MQSKVNIFHSLQHASDSEEENDAQTNKTKKIAEKKEQRAQRDEKKSQAVTKQATVTGGGAPKENHTKSKAPYKAKGVTDEAHPLDRHSGHNNQAYGDKPKKQGAGKGNWGNYKEDKKNVDDENKEAGEPAEETSPTKVEEAAPVGITLAEYYQTRSQAQNQPQVNEAKAKITSEQLTKELGTATVLKTKAQQQIDDKKVGKKKDRLDVNHHAAINSENANLLNFRTGFVEKEYRPRGEGELAGPGAPRTRGPREGRNTKEDAKEEEVQTVTEAKQGEVQPDEATNVDAQNLNSTTNQVTQDQGQQGQGNQNRRNDGPRGGHRGGRGGYRGGERNQGDRPQGDRPQGDRPQGDRPRKQQGGQGQIKLDDDSAFPKLG